MMPRQFSLKSLLWLMGAVAVVLTGWEMIDLAEAARKTGDVPYFTLSWLGVVYVTAFVVLARARTRL
jgi:hypothetical protein